MMLLARSILRNESSALEKECRKGQKNTLEVCSLVEGKGLGTEKSVFESRAIWRV